MKKVLKGKGFADVEELMERVTEELNGIFFARVAELFYAVENTSGPAHCCSWRVL